ncbi:MAG: LPXTG cell wall anchor domain-containing protein, partial [Eubacteriales bacterium]|nr:LPXTG cell wall anchor domain-containing protein [Eubacteriales bacterium]
KPVETEPAETTAPDATDGTSVTDATNAPADAPSTGAAAYIYVVLAVLSMAACAVVVLRKKVNG